MLVFIAYSSTDLGFVLTLRKALKSLDIPVWSEYMDELPEMDRNTQIEKSIAEASHFLFVMSKVSVQSDTIRKQLKLALKAKKTIIGIQLDDCFLIEQVAQLNWLHWIDNRSALFSSELTAHALDELLQFFPHTPEPSTTKVEYRDEIGLGKAFVWITIPSGQVEMKDQGRVEVDSFQINKYPITNGEYAKFIEADGYRDPQWWTREGWERRIQGLRLDGSAGWKPTVGGWTHPLCWNDESWNHKMQPVVGVSWYEAQAFCTWASAITGDKILLPTEEQWQRAAQGDDGRLYPWGNEWDCRRCTYCENNSDGIPWSEGHSIGNLGAGFYARSTTTSVTAFEGKSKADSPFGVVDMAGNSWDWTLTPYKSATLEATDNQIQYLICGGGIGKHGSQVTVRGWQVPQVREKRIGFRCIRVL